MQCGILRRGAHGKFVHICLADEESVFCEEKVDDRGVIRSAIIGQKLRSASRYFVFDEDVVFDRDRDPGELAKRLVR